MIQGPTVHSPKTKPIPGELDHFYFFHL